jgi:hypothetical protein
MDDFAYETELPKPPGPEADFPGSEIDVERAFLAVVREELGERLGDGS